MLSQVRREINMPANGSEFVKKMVYDVIDDKAEKIVIFSSFKTQHETIE